MNILRDLIPARYRKTAYAILALAGLVVAAWQTADGDWRVAIGALVTSAANSLAAGNTDTGSNDAD